MNFIKRIFGSKQKVDELESASKNENEIVMNSLLKFLTEKNLRAEVIENMVVLNDLKTSIKVWISDKRKHPNAIVVQINFIIKQEKIEDEVAESLAGIGENIDKAIEHGIKSFYEGVLFAIFESFKETHDPNTDFATKWNEKELLWHPKIGLVQVNRDHDDLVDENRIYNLLKNEIIKKVGKSRFYWIKVFAAKQASGAIEVECTFNNEKFIQAEKKIKEYSQSWKNSKFKLEKQYIIIRQCDKTWAESKYPSNRYRDVIARTIEMMGNCNSESEYDTLFERICKVTMDVDLAFELYCFIPEVYCRLIFPKVKYTDEIMINIPNGAGYSMSLFQFESYWQIKKFVLEKIIKNFDKNSAMKVLSLSANFNALNDALNQESKLEDLHTVTTVLNAFENYNPMR